MSAPVHEASWRDVPGWDALESGLDTVFKALGLQVLLVALGAVTHMAPEAPGSRELFGWIRQILGVFACATTVWMAIGLGRCRAAPAQTGARLPIVAALLATLLAATAQAVGAVTGLLQLLPPERLAGLELLGHMTLLAAAASLLTGVARAAVLARARPVVRLALVGQVALVLFLGLYAAAFLTGALATPDGGAWRTLLGVLVVPVFGLTLLPIHRLARRLSRAASPPVEIEDVPLDAPYRVVKLENRRRGRTAPASAAADSDDGERWIPRHERLLGLHVAPPSSPERQRWLDARDGLRLYFGGLVARVAVALVAAVAPPSHMGGGALAWFVALIVSLGLASGSLAAALGAMRYRRIPRSTRGHGIAQWAGALASLVFVGDLLILLLIVLAAANLASPMTVVVPGLVTGGLVLAAPLVLAWSLARLGDTLGERALPQRAKRIATLLPVLALMLVLSLVFGASEASDLRSMTTVIDLGAFVLGIVLTVQQLHLVHDAAESIDDHVARLDREAEEAAQS